MADSVFITVFPDGAMTIPRALIISLVGFMIVFLILGILAIFVKLMGKAFDVVNSKKEPAVDKVDKEESAPAVKGTPLPDGESQGNIKLTNVTVEEAAVVMALVSHQSGIPLNRLQFNSIKLMED
ncbi:MAG: OadG family protein [Candidatus Fimenecus sp.]